jgi:hypothetical protein
MKSQKKILVLCVLLIVLATSNVFAMTSEGAKQQLYPYTKLVDTKDYFILMEDLQYPVKVDRRTEGYTFIEAKYQVIFNNHIVKEEWGRYIHPLCSRANKVKLLMVWTINDSTGEVSGLRTYFEIVAPFEQSLYDTSNRTVVDMGEGNFERYLYNITIDYLTQKGRM